MTNQNVLRYCLPLLLLAFAFTGCEVDDNPVKTLEQVIQRLPNVQPIQGAENATVNVRHDKDRSYFKISIDNTSRLNGEYNAWCVQIEKNLQRGVTHAGTRLHSTEKDKIFNQLSYIINTRNRYERALAGLSWREIQIAMWVLIETSDYNLATVESRIPSVFEGYNASYVYEILNDVKTNGNTFEPGSTDIRLIYYEVEDNQNGVFEETAWAWAEDVGDVQRSFPIHDSNHPWGWYILYYLGETNNSNVFRSKLIAGAGQNVIEKGTHVGYVDLWVDDNILKVRYWTFEDFCFTESQLNVSTTQITSSVPGSYPYKRMPGTPATNSYTHNVPLSNLGNPDIGDALYYAAHADIENCD
jgi:hypothetical protein